MMQKLWLEELTKKRFRFAGLAAFLVLFLVSCGTLTYTPIKTQQDYARERKLLIQSEFSRDFKALSLKYTPIMFDETRIVKPPSYFRLDSLYRIKLNLESRMLSTAEIDKEIEIEQLVLSSDTSKSYYVEKHAFGLEDSLGMYQVLIADVFVSQSQKIENVTYNKIQSVPRKFDDLYVSYFLNRSFMFPFAEPETAELEFYKLYDTKLQNLSGLEYDQFLSFMLSVMYLAKSNSNLDKSFLIQEFCKIYVGGRYKVTVDEEFEKIEEFFDENNNLLYYQALYRFSHPNEVKEVVEELYEIRLDPYLQLLDLRKK